MLFLIRNISIEVIAAVGEDLLPGEDIWVRELPLVPAPGVSPPASVVDPRIVIVEVNPIG